MSGKTYGASKWIYCFAQFICFLSYVMMTIVIFADLDFKKGLKGSKEALPKINQEITNLSVIVIIGLLRQPFLYRGLQQERLTPLIVNVVMQLICDILCIVVSFKFESHVRIICLVHVLASIICGSVLWTLKNNMKKTEYVVTNTIEANK